MEHGAMNCSRRKRVRNIDQYNRKVEKELANPTCQRVDDSDKEPMPRTRCPTSSLLSTSWPIS
jgi:hypothetical protein